MSCTSVEVSMQWRSRGFTQEGIGFLPTGHHVFTILVIDGYWMLLVVNELACKYESHQAAAPCSILDQKLPPSEGDAVPKQILLGGQLNIWNPKLTMEVSR